jgi:hypothetical protein
MDPHWFMVLLRIQFRVPGFDGRKLKNFTDERFLFWSKISKYRIYHEGRPSFRKSLQPSKKEHPALQNNYFFTFYIFLPTWIRVKPTIVTKINADPDQQHC